MMKEKMFEVVVEKANHFGTLHGLMVKSCNEKDASYYYDMWNGVLSLLFDFEEVGLLTKEDVKDIDDKFVNASKHAAGGK